MRKLAPLFLIIVITALLRPAPASAQNIRIQNIAVVETQKDDQAGALNDLTGAEMREITSVLRREAVKNLPSDRYNVMTSETVLAMGDAVLIDCAEENCVIALGTKIGADFIVRGTLSKIRGRFSLTVEIFETEYGNLRAITPEPIRTADFDELLDKSVPACEAMYKKFVKEDIDRVNRQAARMAKSYDDDDDTPTSKSKSKPERKAKPPRSDDKTTQKMSVGGGALFNGYFGGGVDIGGTEISMPHYGGGAYLFFDAIYATATASFAYGAGTWDHSDSDPYYQPDMPRSTMNLGAYLKTPNVNITPAMSIFAAAGVEYELNLSAKLVYDDDYEIKFDGKFEDLGNNIGGYDRPKASALNALWFKFGAGANFKINEKMYVRPEILYGFRTANDIEKKWTDGGGGAESLMGHGVTVKVGVGMEL